VAGEVQRLKGARSSEHRKLERLRVERKLNEAFADLLVLPAAGPFVIFVSGAFERRADDAGAVTATAAAIATNASRASKPPMWGRESTKNRTPASAGSVAGRAVRDASHNPDGRRRARHGRRGSGFVSHDSVRGSRGGVFIPRVDIRRDEAWRFFGHRAGKGLAWHIDDHRNTIVTGFVLWVILLALWEILL
jgi:hypothetical protein